MRARSHIGAAGFFAALAVVWTFPLISNLTDSLPGPGPGDNLTFLWSFWWMRTALAAGLDFFQTTYLFAPGGADLTLHTHLALPAFLGATAFGSLPVVAAGNLLVLIGLFLNGFCAYLLAWRVTRDRGASLVGGLIFAGAPYIAGHLNGHFNLTTAWTIPLFAMAVHEAMRAPAKWLSWSIAAGLILAATAYIDYYYVIYEIALGAAIVCFSARDWSVKLQPDASSRPVTRIVFGLLAINAALILAIVVTGGFTIPLGSARASFRGLFNPLQAFWCLLAVWLWLRFRPRVVAAAPGVRPRGLRTLTTIALVFLVGAAPLLTNGARLVAQGDYVTQTSFWRSAPKGVDAATLVLGNPFQGIWGSGVQSVYGSLGIDAIESTGWLGIVPPVLAIVAWRARRSLPEARHWGLVGIVFFIWALGPHLMAFGRNTGLILPSAFLRYVPIVNNARMPGRAIIVAQLALAVLAALAIANWRPKSAQRGFAILAVAAAIFVDYVPAPFPLTPLIRPSLYETLRARPERGAVCELPLGIRDGFGGRGTIDDRVFLYQTIHERPLIGGFIARLPRSVMDGYEKDPLLKGLLLLSEPGLAIEHAAHLPDSLVAGERLRDNGIAFVVLNRATAPAALIDYVERVLPLTRIADEHERTLYVVNGVAAHARQPKIDR